MIANEYIFSYFQNKRQSYGQRYGLENISLLMKELDNVHNKLKVIHVAGTNGKGSVVAFLSSIFKTARLKVGAFTSPCFNNLFDMYKINCKNIPHITFDKYFKKVKKVVEKIETEKQIYLTEFEIYVAIAFLCFYEERCDVVLLETGCGGILDATNIITEPLVSIITPVGLDHKNILGKTIQQITKHKTGIIKEKCPVVTVSTQQKSVLTIIKQECINKNSILYIANKNDVKNIKYNAYSQSFLYNGIKFITQILGSHQVDNAILAIKSIEIINKNRCFKNIDVNNIQSGILKAKNDGRFDIISRNPLYILDGAHNVLAAKCLNRSLNIFYPQKKRIFIFGMFKDKDLSSFVKILFQNAFKIFIIPLQDANRGCEVNKIAKCVKHFNRNVVECKSIVEALRKIEKINSDNTAIIACGSISFLYLIKDFLTKRNKL